MPIRFLFVALIVGFTFYASANAAENSQWQTITPGGDTSCAHGSEYKYFVREADNDALLVFFQGGGACWSSQNCRLDNGPTFDPFVTEEDNPANAPYGIFDLSNPDNPFRDHSMIYVSYCTGDVHLGDRSVSYLAREGDRFVPTSEVHHRGYANAMAALEWGRNHLQPKRIVVAGASAGSIAAPFYAGIVGDQFSGAEVSVIADASGGYISPATNDLLRNWGALEVGRQHGLSEKDAQTADFEAMAIAGLRPHPDIPMLRYDAEYDLAQAFFQQLLGDHTPLPVGLKRNDAQLAAEVVRYTSFIDAGDHHMILQFPWFYTNSVNGTKFRDFVDRYLQGELPEPVATD